MDLPQVSTLVYDGVFTVLSELAEQVPPEALEATLVQAASIYSESNFQLMINQWIH